jgi:hypothetical protein
MAEANGRRTLRQEFTVSSPFPGMNPYLEQEAVWHDFHQSFMPVAREMLTRQVAPAYVVRVEEYLFIHELTANERVLLGRADAAVVEERGGGTDARPDAGSPAASVQAPAYARVPPAVDVERHSFLEIRDREGMGLVTVIELLSPSNKRIGPDREQYVAKRRQLFASPTHFVEIDLMRGGPRLPLDDLPHCDYYALVSRAEERPRVGVWPIRLRDRLPVIPIPLRAGDADTRLDLQEALDRVYDGAGYAYYIYRGAPAPPLAPDDAAWAKQLISAVVK